MTKHLKNLYEDLIEQMMMEEVAGLDKDILETLQNISIEKQRMAILSILDKDRRLFMDIKKLVERTPVSATEHIKDVVQMLRKYVEVGDFERKSVGEVQTPQTLVNQILDTIPEHVWSDPNLKWLDNSTGTGMFMACVIERLMDGLVEYEPNDEKRYKYIVEEMIYVAELQAKNIFLYMTAFDPKDEYAMNVYCGSFLDEDFNRHAKDVWGVEKFSCVVMNPPYQTCQEGNKKTQPLWHLFVEKSLSVLVEGGYMAAVHPSGWRNIDGVFKNTQRLLKEKQMLSLKMHSFKDGLKTFGAKIDYDFYCIKNIKNDDFKTKISCVDGTIENMNLFPMEFIPNENINKIFSLIAKDGEEKVTILADSSYHTQRTEQMSKEQTDEFKYPCIYMVKFGENIITWYSSTNKKGHFGIPKVIWGNGASDVTVDSNGDFGLTQFAYAIVDDVENLVNIKKALDSSNFIKEIMNYRDGLGDKYNRKIIATFRKDFWKNFIQ